MTTTHTFQGLNADSKPSSRVLNPPGGSSSNIFGGFGEQPQQQTPVRGNSGNVSQGNSDVFGQGQNQTAGSHQKSRAPTSGDDSFHNLFGYYQTSAENIKVNDDNRVDQTQRLHSRRHCKSPDTFFNIFGNEHFEHRKMFRSVLKNDRDSFTRVFGQPREFSAPKDVSSFSSAPSVNSIKSEDCSQSSRLPIILSSLNHSNVNDTVAVETKADGEDQSSFCISQVFDQNITRRRHRRFSDRGAFNPITGEPYGDPKPKQGSQPISAKSSEVASNKAVNVDAGKLDEPKSSNSDVVLDQDESQPKEEKPQPKEDKPQPTEQDNPQPTEQEKPQPTATPVPAQTAQKQQQSSVFGGGVEEVKEHRSTRVSQPPGGRSTKLW